MTDPAVPASLRDTLDQVLGPAGRVWLARIPSLVAACERRWSLRAEPPFAALHYSYVAPVTLNDGTPAVLKLLFPDNDELPAQPPALHLWDGDGAVRLYDCDLKLGALLLERAEPGTSLEQVQDDEQATLALAGVMRALRGRTAGLAPFRTVAYLCGGFQRLLRSRFDGGTGPLPAALVERAEALAVSLLATPAQSILLHGDLHHGNVLAAQRAAWLAIDPKGLAGPAEYETGAMLHNPYHVVARRRDLAPLLARRIRVLADELGYDPERIRAWGLVHAVLACVWSVDDREPGWDQDHLPPAIACAEALAALKL